MLELLELLHELGINNVTICFIPLKLLLKSSPNNVPLSALIQNNVIQMLNPLHNFIFALAQKAFSPSFDFEIP